jgi:hypothetical protein
MSSEKFCSACLELSLVQTAWLQHFLQTSLPVRPQRSACQMVADAPSVRLSLAWDSQHATFEKRQSTQTKQN